MVADHRLLHDYPDMPSPCRPQVFENFFFPDRPFDQRRHVIVTTALVITSMLSECSFAASHEGRD